MPSREISEELKPDQGLGDAPEEQGELKQLPPTQLQISPEMELNLTDIVLEDFRAAKEAREKKEYGTNPKGLTYKFDEWFKIITDQYYGKRKAKTIPWEHCSNRSLRISAAILDTLHARLFSSVVNEDLVRWQPGGAEDGPKVERITKIMKWWVWVRSRMRGFFDTWTKGVIGYGEIITESGWRVDLIDKGITEPAAQLDPSGQPIQGPEGPVTQQAHVVDFFEKSESKQYTRENFYLQEGSKDIHHEPVILEDEILFRDLLKGEQQGKFINISTELRDKIPFKKETLRPGITEEEAEKVRDIRLRNEPIKVLKWYGNFDSNADGFDEDVRVYIAVDYDLYIGGTAMLDVTKSGRRPLDFTKFDNRLEKPDENDGEGILEKVKELSDEIDAIFNQLTDSNTLGILRPGFYDPTGSIDAPTMTLGPNKMIPVSDPARNVFFPDVQIQTDKLINAIRLVLEFIERLTAASAYVLGKESEIVGGSGTATRTQAILDSAETRFALPSQRLREGAARIINHHLDLLQKNIPKGLEKRILGEDHEPVFEENEVSQAGISGEFDSYLLMDPSMGSQAADRELSQMFYSVLLQNPIVGTDPAKIYKVTADVIKSHGKEPEEYLGPAPPLNQVDDPLKENTLILQGDFNEVKAQITENHLEHIRVHQDLMKSPTLAALAPHLQQQIMEVIQRHLQEHQQMLQTMLSMVQQFGGGSGGGIGQGNPAGEAAGPQGPGEQSGVENVPGPLGEALNTQREGDIQTPPVGGI